MMKAILTYEGVDFQVFYDVQQPEDEVGFRGAVDISGIYIVGSTQDISELLGDHVVDYLTEELQDNF